MAVAASHVALRDLGLELRECSRMDEAADIFALRSRVSMIEFEDHQIVDPTVDARVSTEVFADERPMTGTDIRVASSRPREVGRTVELVVLASILAAAGEAVRASGPPRPVLDREHLDRLLDMAARADTCQCGHRVHLMRRAAAWPPRRDLVAQMF